MQPSESYHLNVRAEAIGRQSAKQATFRQAAILHLVCAFVATNNETTALAKAIAMADRLMQRLAEAEPEPTIYYSKPDLLLFRD